MPKITRSNRAFFILAIIAVVLALPAFLINLGLLPLFTDEPTRGTIALEFMMRDNFLTPTIGGELYFNKPPLYNWIIMFFWNITGNINEFGMRLPVIVSLFFYSISIYRFSRVSFSKKDSFLNVLIFLTSGRILFWDSMLGLIDIFFSWVVYMNIMLVYYLYNRGKLWALFLTTYSLTAVGFMLKGLPAIVFQGLTLSAFFIMQRKFRLLFSIRNFAGILLFFLIIGTYYFFYFRENTGMEEKVFSTLFNESSKRTVAETGIWQSIQHLFLFPVELLYHFAPWALLFIFLIRKGFWKLLKKDSFIIFNAIMFVVNMLVYWFSPQTQPRYLHMLIPMAFTVFLYFYRHPETSIRLRKGFEYFLGGIAAICGLGALAMPYLEPLENIPDILIISIAAFVVIGALSWYFFRNRENRLMTFALILLASRVVFDLTVLPIRFQEQTFATHRDKLAEVAGKTADGHVFVYKQTAIDHFTNFYFERQSGEILRRKTGDFEEGDYYFIAPEYLPEISARMVDTFYLMWENRKTLVVQYYVENYNYKTD
ncbi:MAG: glycosyltransferase family 39 protein [Bacteroidetes bacterium]|nr:glycosyltransferase family 39 protein [Bacteroidota bacterium]MBU1717512.1 glycosyltransferase family 39 protein [Bacteroidota bacterium]